MLKNFLLALETTGAIKKLERVILVTGGKQYGFHLGRPKNPCHESDRRIDGPNRPPNFYYNQEDILSSYAEKTKGAWDWVVTFPNDVIGLASGNFMNLCAPLGIYAAINKELGGELIWPGSIYYYTAATAFTSSKLHAQFCVWAALERNCSNQMFNVVNGDVESWQNLWPLLAKRFGCKVPEDQLVKKLEPDMSSSTVLANTPPIADFAQESGLVGAEILEASKVESRIDVTKWAERDDVKEAWNRLAEREGLEKSALEKATWWFLRFELGRNFDLYQSMSKARKLGWTGYVDT